MLSPFPRRDPLVISGGWVSRLWGDWFTAVRDTVKAQHHDDGTHGTITADLVRVTGVSGADGSLVLVDATSATADTEIAARFIQRSGFGWAASVEQVDANTAGYSFPLVLRHTAATGETIQALMGTGFTVQLGTAAEAFTTIGRFTCGTIDAGMQDTRWVFQTRVGDTLTYGVQLRDRYIDFPEQTAPANAAANTARLFCQDNGAGKSQLCVIFPTGAVQVLATEP